MDPQGHATLGLGIDVDLNKPTIADLLHDKSFLIKNVLVKVEDNLSVVPANIRLARVAEYLYGAVKREERLSWVLQTVEKQFDICIIDCPPSLGTLTANGLTCADW